MSKLPEEQQSAEPTFPVVTVEGLTRAEFDTRKNAGATNVIPLAGGYVQVISIQRETNAAALKRLLAIAQQHPSMMVLTGIPNANGGQDSLNDLIAHFDRQKKEIGA